MPTDSSTAGASHSEATWNEIEALVHEVASFAKSDIGASQFYTELLDRTVSALAANGGAVWECGPNGSLRVAYQIGLNDVFNDAGASLEAHQTLLRSLLHERAARVFPPLAGNADEQGSINPTKSLLIVCPVQVDDAAVLLIEVFQRPDASPAAQQGYARFLETLCEFAADHFRHQQLRAYQGRARLWGQFEDFSEQVHGSLDLEETAYLLVNEGRRLVECDRVSLALRKGSTWKIVAISGVDTIEHRSNSIRCLEQLVATVAYSPEGLRYPDQAEDIAPQVDDALQGYLDESHARSLTILPLADLRVEPDPQQETDSIGALVFEDFEHDHSDVNSQHRMVAVRRHGELALHNVLDYNSLPLLFVSRSIRSAARLFQLDQLPRTATVILTLAVVIISLLLIPADFTIKGRGELQPRQRQNVFAMIDGVVQKINVDHADWVEQGATLATLRNSDLDFELSQVVGELQTTRQQLSTVQTTRLGMNPVSSEALNRYNELAAEEEELKKSVENLEQQYAILQHQQTLLTVESPISGQVVTWDVVDTLKTRPVRRGQSLMTIADTSGEWVLEVKVPDKQIGHVTDSRDELKPDLDVSFVVATDPGVTYTGNIEDVAVAAEAADDDSATVLVTVKIDSDSIPPEQRRPGATVVPKIHCGTRSLAYVWCRELIEVIQRNILF